MKALHYGLLFLGLTGGELSAQHDHHSSAHPGDSTAMLGAADQSMNAPMTSNAMRHMELSPTRTGTREDSLLASRVVSRLRLALEKYADTTAAVADGFRMFAPQIKNQRVYHFTNYRNAFMAGFRFDPEKPTSILYTKDTNGRFKLVGAMYTAPKRTSLDKLDERVPLSIARWHKHVKWCVPKRGEASRWFEQKDGAPVFGPESPIDTKAGCDAVGGLFFASPLGWMVHANVFAGEDLGAIFAHEHE